MTNFGESPLVLAIEHQQNTAVDFAVHHNINQLELYLAHIHDSKVKDSWNTPQAKLARNKKLRL